MLFEEWSSKQVDKWGMYDIWVRITGCPEALCRDYLALFAVGSLVGKATKIDMKFTREHGVVRARIDCANPQAIPRRLEHYYDGEGFALYFDVEAPDGSIVPAGEFDIGDGEEDDKDNPTNPSNDRKSGNTSPHGEHKPSDDSSRSKAGDKSMEKNKEDEMQQDTMESSIQVGEITVSYGSPVKEVTENISSNHRLFAVQCSHRRDRATLCPQPSSHAAPGSPRCRRPSTRPHRSHTHLVDPSEDIQDHGIPTPSTNRTASPENFPSGEPYLPPLLLTVGSNWRAQIRTRIPKWYPPVACCHVASPVSPPSQTESILIQI
jgi:hypothetical protein